MRKKFAKPLSLPMLFVACVLLILTACSDDESQPDTISTKSVGAEGGELKGSDGRVNLSIPEGAMAANTQVGIEATEEVADQGVGKVYTFTPEGTEFAKPVSVSLQYTEEDIKNISPSRLAIAYKKADDTWQVMPVLKADAATKTITTETTHFSQWSLVDGFPFIESIDPKSGFSNVATTITITGGNFSSVVSENVVTLNDVTLTVVSASTTALVVILPAGSASGQIKVTVSDNEVLSGDTFTVSPALPTITSFSPTSAVEDFNTTITITGTNFSTVLSENTVTLNGVALTVASATTTSLIVMIPAFSTTGPIKVSVKGVEVTSSNSFTVISTTPTITGFTPVSANDDVQTTVTITGTNFSTTISDNVVTLNGVPLTVFSVATGPTNSIMIVGIPAGLATGPIKVAVNNKTVTSAETFTVISTTPTITGFSPTSANDDVQTTVAITGTNFSPNVSDNVVTLNGVPLTVFSVVTNSTNSVLMVGVPAGLTSGPIKVAVKNKAATSTDDFTVISTAPTITGFNPSVGTEGIDITITITGTNFSTIAANNVVSINGNILSVSATTSTQLSVNIPGNVRTGPIKITVNGKTATSDKDFVFSKPAPMIDGFTPTSGASGLPTTVTITGANFSPILSENVVTINGIALDLISATTTTLLVVVPAGATSGHLEVSVSGKFVLSSSDFIIE